MPKTNTVEAGARTQHTPGPWITDKEYPTVVICEDDHTIVIAQCGHKSNPFAKRNARLIASAPDLLEACRKAEAGLTQVGAALAEVNDRRTYRDAEAGLIAVQSAIAKAEGRE